MAKILAISFKDSELELYEKVIAHSGYSAFVKDALKHYIEYLEQSKRPSKKTTPQNELNTLLNL
jgi:hypothetical protein